MSTIEGEGVNPQDCPHCGGTGYIAKPVDISGRSEGVAFIRLKCPACNGSGRRNPTPSTTG
jgi:DnaJ-class molecular chaperone